MLSVLTSTRRPARHAALLPVSAACRIKATGLKAASCPFSSSSYLFISTEGMQQIKCNFELTSEGGFQSDLRYATVP
jgi:hypothetical protein